MTEAEELIEWFRNDSKTANGYMPSMMRRVIEAFDKVVVEREAKAWEKGLEEGFDYSYEGHNGEYHYQMGAGDPLEDVRKENPYNA